VQDETRQISFISKGDKELWVLNGGDWKLPVYVDPVYDREDNCCAFLTPAVSFLGSWYAAADKMIRPLSIDSGGKWLIPFHKLQEIATKANGVTPSYYVVWEREQLYPHNPIRARAVQPKPNSDSTEDFMGFMADEHNLFSKEQLGLFFTALRECAMKWMIERNLPIDLGFVKLVPVPFRVNWKQMLDSWLTPSIFRLPFAEREQAMMDHGFDEMLINPRLMAVDMKVPRWTIEVVPSKEWLQRSSYRENLQLKKYGTSYVEHLRDVVYRMRRQLVDLYRLWLAQKNIKAGYVYEGVDDRLGSLRPSTVLGHRLPDNCPRCATNRPYRVGRRPGTRRGLFPPIAPLHEMSDIQPSAPDLRDPGSDVGQPADREG